MKLETFVGELALAVPSEARLRGAGLDDEDIESIRRSFTCVPSAVDAPDQTLRSLVTCWDCGSVQVGGVTGFSFRQPGSSWTVSLHQTKTSGTSAVFAVLAQRRQASEDRCRGSQNEDRAGPVLNHLPASEPHATPSTLASLSARPRAPAHDGARVRARPARRALPVPLSLGQAEREAQESSIFRRRERCHDRLES